LLDCDICQKDYFLIKISAKKLISSSSKMKIKVKKNCYWIKPQHYILTEAVISVTDAALQIYVFAKKDNIYEVYFLKRREMT